MPAASSTTAAGSRSFQRLPSRVSRPSAANVATPKKKKQA